MPRETIIIEAHYDKRWNPAAELVLSQPEQGRKSRSTLSYLGDYIEEQIDGLGARDARSFAEAYPLSFGVWSHDTWPAFLLDIVPAGAARRWWMDRLGTRFETERQLDWLLLRDHTVAPIGHIRVAPDEPEGRPAIGFERAEVLKRDARFLEYAAERGAAIGGATGAGGDAPKILLAEDDDGRVFPAGTLADFETKSCLFVKWPRGRDTHADRVVLKTEHLYARVLHEVGLDTCPGEFFDRQQGHKPSLWLPRFDRIVHDDHLERLPVESLYSLAGIAQAGSSASHQQFLNALRNALARRDQLDDLSDLVGEYLRRELLDLILGNSDNHGRNRALIRGERLRWTPIYDLAPMVLDPSGITRSTRWAEHERGGEIDWNGVFAWLDDWLPELDAREIMGKFAGSLLDLPERLRAAGADDLIFEHPAIRVGRLKSTFERWGLR